MYKGGIWYTHRRFRLKRNQVYNNQSVNLWWKSLTRISCVLPTDPDTVPGAFPPPKEPPARATEPHFSFVLSFGTWNHKQKLSLHQKVKKRRVRFPMRYKIYKCMICVQLRLSKCRTRGGALSLSHLLFRWISTFAALTPLITFRFQSKESKKATAWPSSPSVFVGQNPLPGGQDERGAHMPWYRIEAPAQHCWTRGHPVPRFRRTSEHHNINNNYS